MQALRSARSKLDSALDEYARACLTLVNCSASSPAINSLQDLAESVNIEVDAFASIKDKSKRVEATLNKARNSLFSVVPINSLPDEVLVRIFHWVVRVQSLDFEKLVDEDSLPVKSLAVSQVCARWHQVSHSSRSLWSHIDLSIRDKVVLLGREFASRSGDQSLSVRIVEPLRRWSLLDSHSELDDFISSFGSRMESLEFAWVPPPPQAEFSLVWFHILESSIFRSTKKLTRLALSIRKVYAIYSRYYDSSAHWFLVVDDGREPRPPIGATGLTVALDDIPEKHYEDILFNVKVLWLDLVYPMWTSKAYHGLTELRLRGPPRLTAIITVEELANILAASPGLCVLHLGVEVRSTRALPPPICLEDLEVFLLQSLSSASQQAIVRLILPGRKPLQMSTTHGEAISELPAAVEDEFCRFFRRSNIVQLQVHSAARVLPELLPDLLPNIQTLIFRGVFIFADDISAEPSFPELSALHFISCTMHLDSLLWLISGNNLRKVTVWDCAILEGDSQGGLAENFRSRLTEVCPVIRLLGATEYQHTVKIEGWGEDIRERMENARENDYDLGQSFTLVT
ncbi:hypothetical protein FRC11_014500 [Ceratobasidium sp. 423]|nr:hypothetical protein FRC11_014500 [Ceratobasidium sp. 423]